jgi:hypothetical protein
MGSPKATLVPDSMDASVSPFARVLRTEMEAGGAKLPRLSAANNVIVSAASDES